MKKALTVVSILPLITFLFGIGFVGACHGHKDPQQEAADALKRGQNTIDGKKYAEKLAECRAIGRDAGLDAYEECSQKADAWYKDGGK